MLDPRAAREWIVDQKWDLLIGQAARHWKSVAIKTKCHYDSEEAIGWARGISDLQGQMLWFAEPGDTARVHNRASLMVSAPTHCLFEIGTRGPHPWDETQFSEDFEVVEQYCYRDGTATAGPCE